MKFWRWLLYGTALWCFLLGLWNHDASLIFAGAAVAVIYPLISADIEEETHELPVCAGCSKGRLVPGCPIHDTERRKAA